MTRDTLTSAVASFIEVHGLLSKGQRHIVALSGGADSVALLLTLLELGYDVDAAHCNFHLRGDEADCDERFVRSLCEAKGVAFHIAHFDTRGYAEAHGVSIEMAARDLRYDYFDRLRSDIGAGEVCVAHHADDSVETVLMNLMRGTGIHGLTGISPRNGHVVRPLLCVSRADILDYLSQRGQDYVTDSSNLVADVVRNKVRLCILPLMAEVNPSVAQCIMRTADNVAEAAKVYDSTISAAISSLERRDGAFITISIAQLRSQPSLQCVLHELLSRYGFSRQQALAVGTMLDAGAGRVVEADSWRLTIHQGNIVIAPKAVQPKPMRLPIEGTYVYAGCRLKLAYETVDGDFNPRRGADVACLDAERVKLPLTVRPVERGDRFVPFGMKGSRLVSDYLTDRKRNIFQREGQLALFDATGAMAWLVGERTDNRFAIGKSTTRALVVTLTKEQAHSAQADDR